MNSLYVALAITAVVVFILAKTAIVVPLISFLHPTGGILSGFNGELEPRRWLAALHEVQRISVVPAATLGVDSA